MLPTDFQENSSYLQGVDFVLEPLVLGLQVPDAVLGLTQLRLQLGLQLPTTLLELLQLFLGVKATVVVEGRGGGARGVLGSIIHFIVQCLHCFSLLPT